MRTKNLSSSDNSGLGENLVNNFRLQFNMYFGLSVLILLGPYVINHFIRGRFAMGLFTGCILIISGTNSISIYRRGIQLIPFGYFYAVIIGTLISGLFLQGESIIYWYYPFALIVLASATRKQARNMLIISAATLIPAAFYTIEFTIAARFSATYIMVCLLGDLVVGLIDKAQRQQDTLAITDPLTGALNRRTMLVHIEEAAEACRRRLGTASLLTIDIDHFKNINDSYGHSAGDDALTAVVDIIIQRKRKLDKLFRTGGEEFIMLARDLDADGSLAFADSLRAAVAEGDILEGKPITVSIGVANYESDENIDDWIRRADDHMYLAKRHGRNCISPPYIASVPAL